MRNRTVEYRGARLHDKPTAVLVTMHDHGVAKSRKRELSPARSQRLRNHSPTGFNWGYEGSGPAQLALAILLNFTDNEHQAQTHYQHFKREFVAKWGDEWTLSGSEIERWLEKQRSRPTSLTST